MNLVLQFQLAMGFLTRVPVGTVRASDADFARSLRFFPVVGLFIGTVLSFVAWALAGHLTPQIVAGILVALSALLTGGLHLDGLADVFDGLGGGCGSPQRMLDIMRDSRIGSHGACALIVYVLLKVAVLSQFVATEQYVMLALAPMVARTLIVPIIVLVPYVREKGLGSSFQEHAGTPEILLALATFTLTALSGYCATIACICAATAVYLFTTLLVSKLRGVTGDGYGALIELAELAFLVGLAWA